MKSAEKLRDFAGIMSLPLPSRKNCHPQYRHGEEWSSGDYDGKPVSMSSAWWRAKQPDLTGLFSILRKVLGGVGQSGNYRLTAREV